MLLVLDRTISAQVPSRSPERITKAVDDRMTVRRPGNRHPLARPEFDAGAAAPETRMERMVLVLEPDAAQQQELEALVAAQQDPVSPQYQQWLSPEEFGRRFGVSEQDLKRVTDWLEGHGFEVEPVSIGRREILFSGTAGQVQSAFHTEVHGYNVNGASHHANAADPEIPEALAEVVSGIVSLHDFHTQPQHRIAETADVLAPDYTSGSSHYLSPADFATIYDVTGLYSQSIDGTGQAVAVVGRTNLKLSDVQAFRSQFGLPANNPTVVLNGPDPGIVSADEQMEAMLDVEWAGAVARKASIQFVVSASTNTTDGVSLSAQYIVNHNLAPIVTLSFSSCEAAMGTSGNKFWNALWQQAAAQGMTVLVASGDSGAAGCDGSSAQTATAGAAVNGLCSTPYSSCVGGTQFADTANPGTYWSSSNTGGTYASALSYIPEATWNTSATISGGSGLWASGGGVSQVYGKPSWQAGPGVPSDGHRDVPDVSLTSSSHDAYLVVMNGKTYAVAGTSAATPSLAGLLALVLQKVNARQGNVNPAFYTLAAKQAAGGAAVFHDITAGNNSVPGVSGFSAGAGYDAATGLGSVDASILVNHWTDASVPAPAFQVSANPASVTVTQGSNSTVTLGVTVSGGFNSPIALSTGALPAGVTAALSASSLASPGSGSVSLKISAGAQMTPGSYTVSVAANGGGLSKSVSLPVTIVQNCSYAIAPSSATVPAAAGSYSVAVTTQAGCSWNAATATGWISLTSGTGTGIGKVSYSAASNNSLAARTGAITIAGLTLNVTQAGATSVYTLNPASASFPSSAGSGTIAVSVTPSSSSWTATSGASWITITSGASGAGSQTVKYSVAANTSTAARTATISIGNVTFSVSQAAAQPVSCSYKVSLGAVTATPAGFAGSVTVTAGTGCAWTGASNAPWLAIISGSLGTGNGTLSYLAAPNTGKTARSGVLTVAGFAITFTEGPSASKPMLKFAPPAEE